MKCILHLTEEDKETGDITQFTDKTFEKARQTCGLRKKMKNSKYKLITDNFPLNYSAQDGYHHSCYKLFTALNKSYVMQHINTPENLSNTANVSKTYPEVSDENIDDEIILSASDDGILNQDTEEITTTNLDKTGNADAKITLSKVCIFCKKTTKKINYRREYLTRCKFSDFKKIIQDEANIKNDSELLMILKCDELMDSEILYHSSCRKKLYNDASSILSKVAKQRRQNLSNSSPTHSIWSKRRKLHKEAFIFICQIIEQNVLKRGEVYTMAELRDQYIAYASEFRLACGDNDDELDDFFNFQSSHLLKKISRHFRKKVSFTKIDKKTILYKSVMPTETVKLKYEDFDATLIRKTAYLLRKDILELKSDTEIPLEEFLKNDYRLPESLKLFFESLIGGPSVSPEKPSENISRKVQSIAQDTIYATTRGKIVPKKHLVLGVAVKSMTGSKQLVTILNRFGHTINYSRVEEIETNIADQIALKQLSTPLDIVKSADVLTYTAFDNYDENCETLSGAGTLHETVGICIQKKIDILETDTRNEELVTLSSSTKKRRYENKIIELEPYTKKLKLNNNQEITKEVTEEPISHHDAKKRDLNWILSLATNTDGDIPMWVGYNSITVKDEQPVQRVAYLQNYDESSTNPAMILETLKVTQNIAKECHQDYGVVTYDLAIAKPAIQIQSLEHPKFKNIFIQFGAFHLFMSYFGTIGKYITGSGGPYVLVESGVLANNSVKSFLSGKFFNRCKRIHVIFSAALQLLHIKSFEENGSILPGELKTYLNDIFKNPNIVAEETETVTKFFQNYDTFCQETRQGTHGATAQFWMIYVDLVQTYLLMSRAVRMNDVELFTYCLPKMINMFFVMNHQNYARWMVVYHSNLLNLPKTYPGLKEKLENGGLSVKRTNIPFSGTPVDQTLEHTINRDAANRKTGITAFTDQLSARVRWTVTRFARSQVISCVKDMAGMEKAEDASVELQKYRIKRDNNDIKAICSLMQNNVNPFSLVFENDHNLYNLETGKAASQPVSDFLLNSPENGEKMRKDFIQECNEDSQRFDKPIKRTKILNFETDGMKVKGKDDNKLQQIRYCSSVFGRLCCLALEKKISIEKVLSYELTPVPLSLVQINGAMHKTDKSQLQRLLQKLSAAEEDDENVEEINEKVDNYLIDAMFYLHTLPPKLPNNYGDLSKFILQKLLAIKANRVDLIFDTYVEPSIKDCERSSRGDSENHLYIIKGCNQTRPQNFQKALQNSQYKRNLINFLINDWKRLHETNELTVPEKHLYVTENDLCFTFTNHGIIYENNLKCGHEEADTRLFYTLYQICETSKYPTNNVIRSSDTDVLIILIGNFHKINRELHQVWIDCGNFRNPKKININKIHAQLYQVCREGSLAKALPGFHCFTGCDYTAAFCRKGKVKPFNILKLNRNYQKAFENLGSSATISPDTIKNLEKFTCSIYGEKCEDVNVARTKKFLRANEPKEGKNIFDVIKNTDPNSYPPTKNSLLQKIKRCHFICQIWNKAEIAYPLNTSPEENGWQLNNEKYQPVWTEGGNAPEGLDDIAEISDDEECAQDDINYSEEDDNDDEY